LASLLLYYCTNFANSRTNFAEDWAVLDAALRLCRQGRAAEWLHRGGALHLMNFAFLGLRYNA
jgi:hypothetical protein